MYCMRVEVASEKGAPRRQQAPSHPPPPRGPAVPRPSPEQQRSLPPQRPAPPAKNASCFLSQLFLCLSRACLGKMIAFSFKTNGAQKHGVFFAPAAPRRSASLAAAAHVSRPERQRSRSTFSPAEMSLCFSFSCVCPEPVLANIRSFSIKMSRHKRRFHTAARSFSTAFSPPMPTPV